MSSDLLEQRKFEADDSIGNSLNTLESLLNTYSDNDELLEAKRILQQAFLDYERLKSELLKANILGE